MGVGKMQIQAVTKGYRLIRDNKTKVITASNVWIYIYIYIYMRTCFLDPVFMRPGLEISLLDISGKLFQEKVTLLLETTANVRCVKRQQCGRA